MNPNGRSDVQGCTSHKHRLRELSLALVVGVLSRVAVIAWLRPPPSWDGWIYAALAERLVNGEGFVHWDGSGRATAFFPVGYPAAIAAARALFAGVSTTSPTALAAWTVNVLSGALAIVASYFIGDALGGARGARRAAWSTALYPGALLWSAAVMTESLQAALLAVALAFALAPRASNRRSTQRETIARLAAFTLLSGGTVGLASLVRPQSLLLAPCFGALLGRTFVARATCAVVATCAALSVIAPWTARNARVLDGPALVSTNGGSNLLLGALEDARGGYRPLTAHDPCATVRGEVARDRCMAREARSRIARAPQRWTSLALKKIVRTFAIEWAPVSYPRSVVADRLAKPLGLALAALCTATWWLALGAAIMVMIRTLKQDDHRARGASWGVLASIASVALVHAVFIADDRYHLPLYAIVCAAASATRSTLFGVERVAEPIAGEVEAEDGERDGSARDEREARGA